MALIKCPNCGKEYSEHAEKCPQCGMAISEAEIKVKAAEAEHQRIRKENKKIFPKIAVCVFALAVLGIGTILFINFSKKQSASDLYSDESEEYVQEYVEEENDNLDYSQGNSVSNIIPSEPFGSEEIDNEVLEFLNNIYGDENSIVRYEDVMTERCCDYSGCQFDYDIIYQTQDLWCAVNPEPRYEKKGDLYKVTWHFTSTDDNSNILKIIIENGEPKIDNFAFINDEGSTELSIDYSKQPVYCYDMEAYETEVIESNKKKYGHLPN